MYAVKDFPTKKALKAAVAAGEQVEIYSPGPFPAPQDGETTLEGPHYPRPHTWYARVRVANGVVVKVIS